MKQRVLLKIQAFYYILTGVWPWISMKTFLMVTGPKSDLWLVKVVGILILVCGITLFLASLSKKRNGPIIFLAIGYAVSLAFADILFFLQNIIPAIYLADALLEVILIVLWITSIYKTRKSI